jgi:hypothetical protein
MKKNALLLTTALSTREKSLLNTHTHKKDAVDHPEYSATFFSYISELLSLLL